MGATTLLYPVIHHLYKLANPRKDSNVMKVFRGTSLGDGLDLLGIHGDSILGDDQRQVRYLFLVELSFVGADM
jgi:hypothetical protein